jgi:hypothetical protein
MVAKVLSVLFDRPIGKLLQWFHGSEVVVQQFDSQLLELQRIKTKDRNFPPHY